MGFADPSIKGFLRVSELWLRISLCWVDWSLVGGFSPQLQNDPFSIRLMSMVQIRALKNRVTKLAKSGVVPVSSYLHSLMANREYRR